MSFDDYVNHMSQKHRLAVAIAVLKEKPEHLSINQYIKHLQQKIGQQEKMEIDDSKIVCDDDFNFDDEDFDVDDDATIILDEFNTNFDDEIESDGIQNSIILLDEFRVENTDINNEYIDNDKVTSKGTSIAIRRDVPVTATAVSKENDVIFDLLNTYDNNMEVEEDNPLEVSQSILHDDNQAVSDDSNKGFQFHGTTENTQKPTDLDQRIVANVAKNITKGIAKDTQNIKEDTIADNSRNFKEMKEDFIKKCVKENLTSKTTEKTHDICIKDSQNDIRNKDYTNSNFIKDKTAVVLKNVNKNNNNSKKTDKEPNICNREQIASNNYKTNNTYGEEPYTCKKSIDIDNTFVPDTNHTKLYDTQETILYTVPGSTQNSQISQSQSQSIEISSKYIVGNKTKLATIENRFDNKIDNLNEIYKKTTFTNGNPINNINEIKHTVHNPIQNFNNNDDITKNYDFNQNLGNSSQIEYIIDKEGRKYAVLEQFPINNSDMQSYRNFEQISTLENIETNSQNSGTHSKYIETNLQNPVTNCENLKTYSQNIGPNSQNSELFSLKSSLNPEHFGTNLQNLQKPGGYPQNIETNLEHQITNSENPGSYPQNMETNSEINTNVQKNSQQVEDNSDTEVESEELVPFKVIKELSKVKGYLKRKERRKSTDGFSTDSGYRSDSQQSSYKNAHISENWVHQSAHCLYIYIVHCPLVVNTQEIVTEISQVLGNLIDRLHEEEKYPMFLEELLEKVEALLHDVYHGGGDTENILLEKDDVIQRLFLLNKSTHILKFTIEKITNKLTEIHTCLTTEGNLFETTNTQETENLSYIFYLLEALIKKYKGLQNNSSQSFSQEKVLKKSFITDIWKKKWNINKEVSYPISQEVCILVKCSDILNKIVVNCIEGYSLIAFAALQCFNVLQNQ